MAAYVETDEIRETRELVSELCRQFYTLGWVSGTGKRTSLEAQSAISQNSPDINVQYRSHQLGWVWGTGEHAMWEP